MNDLTEDEIREAVDLAEKWELNPSGLMAYHTFGPSEYEFTSTEIADPEQYMLDALAMQLARQAQEKWDEWWHDHKSEWAILHRFNVSMNVGDSAGAIRAILKAKVLR